MYPQVHIEYIQDGRAEVLQPKQHQKEPKYDMEFYHIDVLQIKLQQL